MWVLDWPLEEKRCVRGPWKDRAGRGPALLAVGDMVVPAVGNGAGGTACQEAPVLFFFCKISLKVKCTEKKVGR